MAVISYGPKLVFAGEERRPLKGFPPGKVRIRIRPEEFAMAYVRNETGIFCYYVSEVDGFWTPGLLHSVNLVETYAACRDACPITEAPRKRLHLPSLSLESSRIEAADRSGGIG